MARAEFHEPDALTRHKGEEIFVSDWMLVTQERIDQFARSTDDYQWVHVDAERAAQSPFGGTIAHGFLTLSLLSKFYNENVSLTFSRYTVNCGFDKVRFTNPVRVGSRIRGRFGLAEFEASAQKLALTWSAKVEIEGSDKPAVVALWKVFAFHGVT